MRERAILAHAGIAIFEDQVLLEAQPPASDEALAEVSERCAGERPADLLALWRTAFGGTLDYDLRCDFGGHEATLSFRELFYPTSGRYHDIWGWIVHEEDLGEHLG